MTTIAIMALFAGLAERFAYNFFGFCLWSWENDFHHTPINVIREVGGGYYEEGKRKVQKQVLVCKGCGRRLDSPDY